MKMISFAASTGAAFVIPLSVSTALALGTTGHNTSQVVLKPIYVDQGLSIVLKNGCSVSVFDAGGSDQGFSRLRKEYLDTARDPNKPPRIDVLLVSHTHKDHTAYLPMIGNDKVEIGTFISNLSSKRRASELGITNLSGRPKMMFKSASTRSYSPVIFPMNDSYQCTSKKVNLELLWGTLQSSDPEISPLYRRHRENNDSVVSGISGDIQPVLFLGDMNIPGQKLLLKHARNQLAKYKGGILIAGHHGFSNGIYEELLSFLKPRKVIISRDISRPMMKKDVETIDRHISEGTQRELMPVQCGAKMKAKHKSKNLSAQKNDCQAYVSASIIQLSPYKDVKFVL